MTRLGYLHYNRFRRTYSPTARVALLGAWVEPTLFRGGPVLSSIDTVFRSLGETTVLSTAQNYLVQHLHVIHGMSDEAVEAHVGDTLSLAHSPQGKLLLSSYQPEHIRSALHRLNAEESDPEKRVNTMQKADELVALRRKGWLVEHDDNGIGTVAILIPSRHGMDRLVLSVVARSHIVESRWEEMVATVVRQRSILEQHSLAADANDEAKSMFGVPAMSSPEQRHPQYA
jgi:DNA-binding IclR family transcriptional regulator